VGIRCAKADPATSPQEIRLILALIPCTQQFPSARFVILADARVVAGGETLGADLPRHAEQRLKLHVCVAVGAGNRRAARKILVNERADDTGFKLGFEVHHVMRKLQMLRHGLCVVDIIERAATVLRGSIALQFGKAALVPELHRQTDDRAALFLEQRRNRRGIHAAGHGDGDEAALDFCAFGKRIELGGRAHALKKGTIYRAPTFSFYRASATFG